MDFYDRLFLSDYFELIDRDVLKESDVYGPNSYFYDSLYDELVDVDPEILIRLFDKFMGEVHLKAEYLGMDLSEIDEPNDMPMEEKQAFYVVVDIVKKACFFMINSKDVTKVEMLNLISATSIRSIFESFKSGDWLAYYIFKEYIGFLIDYFCYNISYTEIVNIEENYPWLADLNHNRGFVSINDMARKVLDAFYLAIFDDIVITSVGEEFMRNFYRRFDEYFDCFESEEILEKHALEFSRSSADIRNFKRYQYRIMLADVYRSLKASSFEDENYSLPKLALLAEVEMRIFNEDYSMPKDSTIRYEIYRQFFLTLHLEHDHTKEMSTLKRNDCVKVLSLANPLYFLDLERGI